MSFTESCFFFIPPELLLLPMCYANPRKAWVYALIATVTSVLGALFGYALGFYAWDFLSAYTHLIPGFQKNYEIVGKLLQENAVIALFSAAFTPIPFKVFTVLSGVYSNYIDLPLFTMVCFAGRGLRYFLLAGLIFFFGERARVWIEKHFALATILIGIIGASGFLFLKVL